MPLASLGALLLGYLLGSIPFGLLLTRAGGAGDLRAVGSGNIGATNVLRTGHKGLAAATLILDIGKGALAVVAARWIAPDSALLGAIGAFVGHCYPIWLRFRGGKGVATYAGIAFGVAWPLGLVYAVVWLAMLAITRISSVGGLSAVVAAPVAAASMGWRAVASVFAALTVVVLWKHRDNIRRLIAGQEPRIGGKG